MFCGLKNSQQVILFNGDGHEYSGIITNKQKSNITVLIQDKIKINNNSPLIINLNQAIIKS